MAADKIRKTLDEWRSDLSEAQFCVAREGGTEAPFSGPHWDTKEPGVYRCVCCGAPLFTSDTKYDSGTGWPSFFQPVGEDAVELRKDISHGMVRTEVVCARCEAHLGHVFTDGPPPTGLRYCMNGTALDLKRDEAKK